MELLNLPSEMIQHIASFMDCDTLIAFGQTCQQIAYICDAETLWQTLCLRDYKVNSTKGWGLSHRDIYLKVLRNCSFFGLKRLALMPYGGLVNVCWAEGEIQINQYVPSEQQGDEADCSCEQLFSIRWDDAGEQVVAFCVQGNNQTQKAEIVQVGQYPLVRCKSDECCQQHHRARLRRRFHLFNFLLGERSYGTGQSNPKFERGFEDHPDAFTNYKFTNGFNCPMLPLPSITHDEQRMSPVRLGLYSGDYGAHGKELIYLSINQNDGLVLEGLKILGDPNVPAGYISLYVDLHKPVILTQDDQMTLDVIKDLDDARQQEEYDALLGDNAVDLQQPYHTPADCLERANNVPDRCLARYLGQGRIAGHYYRHPALCRMHFMKFSDSLFGVLWLELSSFSLFHRVTQEFPTGLAV